MSFHHIKISENEFCFAIKRGKNLAILCLTRVHTSARGQQGKILKKVPGSTWFSPKSNHLILVPLSTFPQKLHKISVYFLHYIAHKQNR